MNTKHLMVDIFWFPGICREEFQILMYACGYAACIHQNLGTTTAILTEPIFSLAHWKVLGFPIRRMMAIFLVFGMLTACSRAGSQATPTTRETNPLPFGDEIQKVLDDGLSIYPEILLSKT
jgi:hypothetical protein